MFRKCILPLQCDKKLTMRDKKVKIDRKVLFEICDAILYHDGYADRNECYDDDRAYFCHPWDRRFRKKVKNIRNNS